MKKYKNSHNFAEIVKLEISSEMDGIPGDFDVLLLSEDEQDESLAPSLTIGDVLETLKKAKDG